MRKIIFINYTPLLPRLKDAYLLDQLKNSGYLVEYWNVQLLLNRPIKFDEELNFSYVYKVNSLIELESKLKTIDPNKTVFIIPFEDIYPYRFLFKTLKKFNCYLIRLNIYPISSGFLINKRNLMVLFSMKGLFVLKKYFKTILYSLNQKVKNDRTFNAYFSCSSYTPRTLKINSLDYEIFQKIKQNNQRLVQSDYIVFLDIFFPLHPELQTKYNLNINQVTKKYQHSMRIFFDQLEAKFKIPVIIAAHPSSKYQGYEFGERKIIKSKTNILVKDSSLVVTHSSTSHVFALLFNKPILFIQTNGMKYFPEEFHMTTEIAKNFKKNSYNIDKIPFEKIEFSRIDEKTLAKYIYTFITSKETDFRSNEEIILSELNNIFNQLCKSVVGT